MKPRKIGIVGFGLLGVFAFLVLASYAQSSSSKTIVVSPPTEAGGSGQQQLEIKGLKTSSDAIGVRIFLDPAPNTKLDANSKSYLGSVYFSHQKDPNSKSKEGNFVLPIQKKVTGPTRVVIYPISSKGSRVLAPVEIGDAQIKPTDNSAFQ
jgi:hypothetical protein